MKFLHTKDFIFEKIDFKDTYSTDLRDRFFRKRSLVREKFIQHFRIAFAREIISIFLSRLRSSTRLFCPFIYRVDPRAHPFPTRDLKFTEGCVSWRDIAILIATDVYGHVFVSFSHMMAAVATNMPFLIVFEDGCRRTSRADNVKP